MSRDSVTKAVSPILGASFPDPSVGGIMNAPLRRVGGAIATVALCVLAMMSLAGPATAADRQVTPFEGNSGTARSVAVKYSMTLTKNSTAGTDSAADVIYCGGYITNPYVSGGAVRADAQASCSAPVDNINLLAALYFGNGSNVAERVQNHPGVASASEFAVFGCLNMTLDFYSFGRAVFTKAGYANSPLWLEGRSPTVSLFC